MSTIVSTVVAQVRQPIPKLWRTLSTTISRCTSAYPLGKCIRPLCLTHDRRQHMSRQPAVHTAASLFQNICYQNKDALSAGIIVAGWDEEDGPSVYNIPLGGGIFRQPWAIGGSGSTYVYGYCDATYQDGWGKDETIEFVKNSTCTDLNYCHNSELDPV